MRKQSGAAPGWRLVSVEAIAILAALIAVPNPAIAGGTIIGPTATRCSKFMSDAGGITIMTMWIEGFLSAANRMNRADFLQGVDGTDVGAFILVDCHHNPDKTVEQVALDAVANFRMLYASKRSQ